MSLFLRYATMDDVELLYEWRNDEVVRMNSFNSNEIGYEEHVSWLKKYLKDECCRIYIIVDDKECVGQIKVRVIDNEAEVGYSIGKKFRGHGYGTKSLLLIKEQLKKDFPNVSKITGRVKVDNVVSKRAFESAEYYVGYIQYVSKV